MKKALLVLISIVLVFVYGCTNNTKPKSSSDVNAKEKFTSNVEVNYNDQLYKGKMNYLKDGYCQLEVSEPENIKGLVVEITADGCKVSLKGLSYNINTDMVPQVSLANIFKDTLDKYQDMDNISIAENDIGKAYSGTVENKKFKLQTEKDGNYKSINFPDENINITFTDFIAG